MSIQPPPVVRGSASGARRPSMPVRERLWLLAAMLLVPVAIFFQQFSLGLQSQTLSGAPAARLSDEHVYDPGVAEFTVAAKLALKERFGADPDDPDLDAPEDVLEGLEQAAITRAERVRLAVVSAELLDKSEAVRRLSELGEEADPASELASDIEWLRRLYTEGRGGVPPDATQALMDRHGWFAEVALTHGMPETSRREFLGSDGLAGFFALLGLGIIGVLLGGVVVIVLAVIRWHSGEFDMRFNQAIGGPVYLELFTLFVGGFALLVSLHLIFFGFNVEGTSGALIAQEVLLWVLAGTLLWPLLRRVPWARYTWDIGLHRGQGFFREVGAGALGWLASTPILLGLSLLIGLFSSGEETPTSGYPLFESPRGSSWAFVIVGMLSAVLWAPLVEEIVFRGALHRYLRPRLKRWGTILVTAALFGLVHPYTPQGLLSVAVIGVLLGFLREWRGSLIAPITAHLLHNGMIMAITLGLLASLE